MNCSNCGNLINPGEKFCNKCGAPVTSNNGVQTGASNNVSNFNNVNNNANMGPSQNLGVNNNPNMNGNMNSNNGQPNNYNPYGNQNNNQGKSKVGYIVLIIAVLVLAVVVVYLVINRGKSDNSGVINDNTNSGGSISDNTNNGGSNNGGSNSNQGNDTGNTVATADKISLGNYSFNLPDGYMYKLEDDGLYIMPNDQSFMAAFFMHEGYSYAGSYKAYAEELKQEMINQGANVTNMSTETYGGLEFLIYELEENGSYVYESFAKIGTYDTVEVMAATYTGDGEAMFNSIANIILSTDTSSSFASTEKEDKKPDFSGVTKDLDKDKFN